jgi:phenylalanyl-tRNA synthetase beta chain
MPTITVKKHDLQKLLGRPIDLKTLDEQLPMVKAELGDKTKDSTSLLNADGSWTTRDENFELRVELNDTNRPDLWCTEGIARQLRDHEQGHSRGYDFYKKGESDKSITVDAALKDFRPFVGGFLADGAAIDEDGLLAFIDTQETLTRNYGRKRKTVSIGIYDGKEISFPVQYKAVGRNSMKFEPLAPAGSEEGSSEWQGGVEMTPDQILKEHPTGREYAGILEGLEQVPMLMDSDDKVLSFPPIINSAHLGRVKPGMDCLFIEVTGTEHDQVLLSLNIMAANLADRGWAIHPVTTHYPYETDHGRAVRIPHDLTLTQELPVSEFSRLLGEDIGGQEILEKLGRYGVSATLNENIVKASIPSYRQDYLHPVDVIEDYAISRGYENFEPCMPADFTVGKLHPMTEIEDKVRDRMIGFGFEEGIGNILGNIEDLRLRMELGDKELEGFEPFHGRRMVSISNVMNLNYAHVRDWLLPTLLETESRSASATYPHRVFECGEVAVHDPTQILGSRTETRCAALMADEKANFDTAQSAVYALLGSFNVSFEVQGWAHPSFIEGRAALILVKGQRVGFLGEISPQVIENWNIRVPLAALEISLAAFGQALQS